MKLTELKKVLKQVVREAIQEELKDIIVEAIKSPNGQPITENKIPNYSEINSSPMPDLRNKYSAMMGNMTEMNFTSADIQPKFTPTPGSGGATGALPPGDVGMDQIMGLLNTK